MEMILPIVSVLLVLFLVGRGLPAWRWPIVIAGTLAVVVLVVAMERGGYWPAGWRVR